MEILSSTMGVVSISSSSNSSPLSNELRMSEGRKSLESFISQLIESSEINWDANEVISNFVEQVYKSITIWRLARNDMDHIKFDKFCSKVSAYDRSGYKMLLSWNETGLG